MMDADHRMASLVYSNPEYFALKASGCRLYSYQREVLKAVVHSIREGAGRLFVIIFARQSGKNELQAQLFAYLLAVLADRMVNIVSVSPTMQPQGRTCMRRLERVLSRNLFTRRAWKKRDGHIFRVGSSQVIFLSGAPTANVVGQTAHVLLSVDEAQALDPDRFDRDFAPMAASHNATRVFWGTAWTSSTLLARQRRLAEQAQQADGLQRVWIVPGEQVGKELPAYARFLQSEIALLGRDHPIIRTQYFCEEIDAQAGMFPPARLALMEGDEPPQPFPLVYPQETFPGSLPPAHPSRPHAFLLDVAGQDEACLNNPGETSLAHPDRDAVSLTIASVDLGSLSLLKAPTYRFIHRLQWSGLNHLDVFGRLKSLAESWKPRHIVMDATGVGEGLWAMLDRSFPGQVIPVKFTRQVKSELGWRFLAIIESGRLRDCTRQSSFCQPAGAQVLAQYLACQMEVLPGYEKIMRWGVPTMQRGPDGAPLHDDCLLADALVARLDNLQWSVQTDLWVGGGYDPLERVR